MSQMTFSIIILYNIKLIQTLTLILSILQTKNQTALLYLNTELAFYKSVIVVNVM